MENKLGNYLKEKRTERTLTINELASKVEVSESQIEKWESGEKIPDNVTLIALSVALRFSLADLPKTTKKQETLDNILGDLYQQFFSVPTLLLWAILCLVAFNICNNGALENFIKNINDSNNFFDGSFFLFMGLCLTAIIVALFIYASFQTIKYDKIIHRLEKENRQKTKI